MGEGERGRMGDLCSVPFAFCPEPCFANRIRQPAEEVGVIILSKILPISCSYSGFPL
jgi:hypothetical protein